MSENRFAVFEEIGDEVGQISVWLPRERAQKHAEGCGRPAGYTPVTGTQVSQRGMRRT